MRAGGRQRTEQFVLLVLGIAVIVLAALDTGRFFARLDLSANRMYSLSEVSKRIARDAPDEVSLTYYVSERLGSRYPFPSQISGMLQEYAAYSRGRITVTVIDPARTRQPFQPENLGLVAQQMQVVEKQEINLATVYSGIVIQYLDRYDTLPFVSDTTTLEYDLSSRIRALISHTERVVGVLLGDSRRSLEADYGTLLQMLQSQYRVQPVPAGEDIPAGLSALLVIGSRDLDEHALFPVDQYIMAGGRVLFAVSPIDVDLSQGLRATRSGSSALGDMLAGYGVRVRDELLLDSVNQRISFRIQQNRLMVVSYPHWVTILPRSVARDSPITSRFSGLDLYWPSPLEIVSHPGVSAQVLVSSSPDAWTMRDPLETNPALSQTPAVQDAGPRRQYPLAVSLSGSFTSFFSGKSVPTRPGERPRTAAVIQRSPDTRMIVVGDAPFASDMVRYTNASYNMDFLSNCASWLGSEDDLLTIKTRSQVDLRLNRITDPAARARAMLVSQLVSVVLIPLLVVAFGVLRFLGRRSKAGLGRARDNP